MTGIELLFSHWHIDWPTIITAILLVVLFFYWHGSRFTKRNLVYFAGVALLLLVNLSSMDFLGRHYLFSAHMIQHIILLLLIPPLLLVGIDPTILENYMAKEGCRKAGRVLFNPFLDWILGVGSMWIWHIPGIFKAMKHSETLMTFQMLSLLILGAFFIWPVFTPVKWKKLNALQSSLYLFTACVGCTVLGIFITFSPQDLYTTYLNGSDPAILALIRDNWGITPDVDQQMGGLIMWVPACFVYLSYILISLSKWFTSSEEE
jgi:putative membrane protein